MNLLIKVYKEEIDQLRFKMNLGITIVYHTLDTNIIIHYMNTVGFVLVSKERIHMTWEEYDKFFI